MAANCNVISLVWDWVSQKSLALTIGDLSLQPFIDEFNRVSGCKEVIPCQEEEEQKPCSKDEIYLCNFLIGTIDVDTDPTGLTFIGAPISRYTNGFPPYGVFWSWDPAVFSLVSGQGTPSVVLQKQGGVAAGTQTTVSVRADDGNGCKDSGAVTFGFPEAIIDCPAAALVIPAMYLGVPYNGTLEIPYTAGNGEFYASMTVQSTGILGMTAHLTTGNLATGNGILSFHVSGTPQGNGTGTFSLKLFGDTPCIFTFKVAEAVCQPTQIEHVYHPYDSGNNWYPVELKWIPRADATEYRIEWVIGFGAPNVIIVPAPASSTFIYVPALAFYSVQIFVTCLFDSTPVGFADTAPGVPAPCPQPTNMTASVTGWNPITLKFNILVRWDIMTGATAYIFRDVSTGQSFVQGGRTRTVQKDPNGSYQFGATVDCGNLAGESPEKLVSINTPAAPTAGPPATWPQLHYMDNVSTSLLNASFMQTWFTIQGDSDYAQVFQGSPFWVSGVLGDPQFDSDSGPLYPGSDNGYTPTPPGFGPNDIFFGTETPPKGLTLYGSALNFVRIAVVRGTSIPFQGWATYFDYWMNVPENYTIRMSNEDYISTDPSLAAVRPTLNVAVTFGGIITATLVPKPALNYDACSKYNMFLVSESGIITTRTQLGTPLTQTFNVTPGRYLLFAEHTYNTCSVPGNVETAIPVLINITV